MIYLVFRLFMTSLLIASVFPAQALAQSAPAWRGAITPANQLEHCRYFVSCALTGRPPAGYSNRHVCMNNEPPPGTKTRMRDQFRGWTAPPAETQLTCSGGSNPYQNIDRLAAGGGTSAQAIAARNAVSMRDFCYDVANRQYRDELACLNHRMAELSGIAGQCANADAKCSETSFCRQFSGAFECVTPALFQNALDERSKRPSAAGAAE